MHLLILCHMHVSSQTLLDSGCTASMASFLVLLRAKGETDADVAGLAKAMHSRALRVSTPHDGAKLDPKETPCTHLVNV